MTKELSPSEAAARIGATTRTVQRWIATGVLPARRVGGRWRVAIDALDALHAPPGHLDTPGRVVRTVFVANRGEIAARIRRTCDRLDVHAVIPATDGPNALDLLDVDAVVGAALAAAADAVHPGFGFLAENADFAEAVGAAGIAWVGPPPAAIRAMGDKAAARRLAARLGVPVIPGYDGDDQSTAAIRRAARRIGAPLLVKPAGGGGGKGMRVVRDLAALDDAIGSSRREAAAAFGDDRIVLERLVEGARHVEVQVLFDAHGAAVHLGERDCSLQRRHQKVLEETPSPAVDRALRERLGGAALRLASAVGYVSAGTCEFLVDDRGEFHFLEMNTRLQVEHPVTELVTGRDLVADQLRIAAGEPLGFDQGDVHADGHAVEVRLYAEDAEAGFLPATGRVVALTWPTGPGIRVDAGIETGSVVSDRFDPMLAKIIAHGSDRAEALDRLAAALDQTLVLGLVTNLRFLRWLVRQPVVRAGDSRIDTLDRIWPPEGWAVATAIPDAAWEAAARELTSSAETRDPWSAPWRLNGPASVTLEADGERRVVRLTDTGADGALARDADVVHVDVAGRSIEVRIAAPPDVDRAAQAAASSGATGRAELAAPMPGAVLRVHAAHGDTVKAGAPIVTLEAMKMEHVVAAPIAGRVGDVLVHAADQVTRGQLLATIDP
ncbi:MAG: biotin carboxylase N-terminal domain-containing protein [Chloroflexota bacterium]